MWGWGRVVPGGSSGQKRGNQFQTGNQIPWMESQHGGCKWSGWMMQCWSKSRESMEYFAMWPEACTLPDQSAETTKSYSATSVCRRSYTEASGETSRCTGLVRTAGGWAECNESPLVAPKAIGWWSDLRFSHLTTSSRSGFGLFLMQNKPYVKLKWPSESQALIAKFICWRYLNRKCNQLACFPLGFLDTRER